MPKITWPNYKRSGIWVDSPPFFSSSKFPHFPVFLWQTSLKQQSHWHKLIEFMAFRNKFKLVLKELALYLSDNPQSILPQYQPMQVAIGQCVQCILTFDTCIGRYWDMDWRIGRWLTVFSVPVVDKWQGYGIVSVILASDWCICLVLVNCCHARLIDILSCHRIVEEIGILLI